jgi:hypothetical protein
MEAVFSIEMSLGSINRLRCEVSESVSDAVAEAMSYIQRGSVLGEAAPRHLP